MKQVSLTRAYVVFPAGLDLGLALQINKTFCWDNKNFLGTAKKRCRLYINNPFSNKSKSFFISVNAYILIQLESDIINIYYGISNSGMHAIFPYDQIWIACLKSKILKFSWIFKWTDIIMSCNVKVINLPRFVVILSKTFSYTHL